ncbi:MAG: PEP-CTERM sorting domain-containing protein [Verrucomicrobiaceae bacterium]|nr:MAG: PEP-CTERM sorting domain-containing protein [Verrucomicrobiaceae bacterium]
MISISCRNALAWAYGLLLSVACAGPGTAVGDSVPEVKVTAVPEPSPLFLLAGAIAVLFLLMRKGGPR